MLHDIETGDFLFGFIGSRENAISAVTSGFRGARVNHLGIAVKNAKGTYLLEAFPPEVRLTNTEVYKRRTNDDSGKPRLLHARLRPEFRSLIGKAIQYGLSVRDVPYDRLYLTDNQSLYCSELVVDMFASANGGRPFFHERPMSFRDLSTGTIAQTWIDYYAYFGLPVPEGEPGSNPGDISADPRLEMIDVIGTIPGYTP
jgi:hypothetical protein